MKLKRLENNKAPELALNKLQAEMKKQIELKIENGKYQFEEIECPICKHKNSEVIGEKEVRGVVFLQVAHDRDFVTDGQRVPVPPCTGQDRYRIEFQQPLLGLAVVVLGGQRHEGMRVSPRVFQDRTLKLDRVLQVEVTARMMGPGDRTEASAEGSGRNESQVGHTRFPK